MVIWGSTQIKMIRMTFSRSYLEGSRRWHWANTRSKLSRSCEKISPWQYTVNIVRKYWVGMGRFGSIIKSIRERWHEGLDRKRKLSQDRSLECSRRSIPMQNKSSTNYRYNSASYHAWHRARHRARHGHSIYKILIISIDWLLENYFQWPDSSDVCRTPQFITQWPWKVWPMVGYVPKEALFSEAHGSTQFFVRCFRISMTEIWFIYISKYSEWRPSLTVDTMVLFNKNMEYKMLAWRFSCPCHWFWQLRTVWHICSPKLYLFWLWESFDPRWPYMTFKLPSLSMGYPAAIIYKLVISILPMSD